MKIAHAVRKSATYFGHHLGQCMLTLLLQLVLRMMALAPILFAFAKETRLLALLCLPLYVLIVFPARANAAIAMQRALAGENLFGMQLVSVENYWGKVLQGVKQALLLCLWGAAWLAATALALVVYSGKTIEGVTDVFTILRTLMALGGGSSIQGAKIVILIYLATLLPLFVGFAFHCGARHARALGNRKLVRGHRLGVMGSWLVSLVTLVPFGAVAAWVGLELVGALSAALASIGTGSMTLPSLGNKIYMLAGSFVLLLLPLIPLKELIPAAYVQGLKEQA